MIKAVLNNEIKYLNPISAEQKDELTDLQLAQYTEHEGVWYFNPQGAVITPDLSDPPSIYHKLDGSEWIPDTSKKQEIIAELSLSIDQETNAILAAGLDFNDSNFPLTGSAYSYNMSAASAYIIGQSSGGRELLTNSGTYVQVDDIAALIAAGEQIVTSTIKNAIDEKAALQDKTTQELINLLEV